MLGPYTPEQLAQLIADVSKSAAKAERAAGRLEGEEMERARIRLIARKRIQFLEEQPPGKFHGGRIDELDALIAAIEGKE